MKRFIPITFILILTAKVFQAQKPVLALKTNLLNIFAQTRGLQTEYFFPAYFSVEAAWNNTSDFLNYDLYWIGNVYTLQTNYYFKNKQQNGWFFSLFAQSGKWQSYARSDYHKTMKIAVFGGGFLFGKKMIISKSKRWMLEPRIGYKQTIVLRKTKITPETDNVPDIIPQIKLDLCLTYCIWIKKAR